MTLYLTCIGTLFLLSYLERKQGYKVFDSIDIEV